MKGGVVLPRTARLAALKPSGSTFLLFESAAFDSSPPLTADIVRRVQLSQRFPTRKVAALCSVAACSYPRQPLSASDAAREK